MSESGAMLGAWFIEGQPGAGAILLVHGIRSNKRAMLPRAKFLHRHGFSVLLIDLQAHGESTGERIGFGRREAADVNAAIGRLRELVPAERLGVLGTSLGAAAVVFSDVQPLLAAVVLESLYPTIDEAVANRLRLRFGPLGGWLSPLLLAQLEPRLGVTPQALRPIERVALFDSPLMLVHGAADRHTTRAEAERLFAAVRAPKWSYFVEGAAHVDLHAAGGAEYEQRIGAFFTHHLRRSEGAHSPQEY